VSSILSNDEFFMQMALNEALKAPPSVAPNPKVGAVIVFKSRIVGSGFHRGPGHPHAEVEAIRDAESRGFREFSKAALFCTLEPCSHFNKRTPPCAPTVAQRRFSRVVVAHLDPNPHVKGRGIKLLRSEKLAVELGCLQQESASINQVFIKNQIHQKPYVTMKLALTFDGRMADDFGHSTWITSKKSRERVHLLRSECDAIAVGSKTIDHDDPQLNVRLGRSKSALKVFVLGKTQKAKAKLNCVKANGDQNVSILNRTPPLKSLLQTIYQEHSVCHLLVEGGPTTASRFLEAGLVDRLILVYGRGLALGQGRYSLRSSGGALKTLPDCINFKPSHVEPIEDDLWVEGYLHVYRPHSK
jgi:diaminohydroxyphosphoribosylaminopyrimidine deaminase/5-amino-6-(5-phosphoribosylamino)uracil reductase